MTISALRPNNYPAYPGFDATWRSLGTNQQDIEDALTKCDLEAAKTNIFNVHGIRTETASKQLLRVIQKIVELNQPTLSKEHEKLNYTLEAANSLGCHIYTAYCNNQTSFEVAKRGISLTANGYEEKKQYHKALDCLSRLSVREASAEFRSLCMRWKKYIESLPVGEERKKEITFYNFRTSSILRAITEMWKDQLETHIRRNSFSISETRELWERHWPAVDLLEQEMALNP